MNTDGSLADIIRGQMAHSLCGLKKPGAMCMLKNNKSEATTCFENFPRTFQDQMIVEEDGHPVY